MRIPDDLLNCAVFIGGRDANDLTHYRATGFIMGLQTELNPKVGWPCLVTARHNVLRALDEFGNVFVRLNTRDGYSREIEIGGSWEFPEHDASDIAAIPFPEFLGPPETEQLPIPRRWCLTPEAEERDRVGIGDEIVIVGLFRRHVGSLRNLPIMRGGMIAAMPQEP
jgi:hypothetical protein